MIARYISNRLSMENLLEDSLYLDSQLCRWGLAHSVGLEPIEADGSLPESYVDIIAKPVLDHPKYKTLCYEIFTEVVDRGRQG